ncbi:unnamed protein product [Clonostachys rosea]|uniref:Histone H1 n=1 Tax=Bionectria ochroleuca TaxID=29856 RepID=A0ABY6U508_BIOOC|nr:unnamed protein product [Clonostachys rosea]
MAPAATTKKAAAAPKAKASHASYQDMIIDAIVNLKDRNGSSRQSLKKYVKANNQLNLVSDKMFDSLFNKALKNGVDKDIFEQPKGPSGGTKLAKKKVEPKKEKKAPAPKKETVVKKTATKATTEKKAPAPKKAAAPKTKAAAEKKAPAPKKAAPKKAAAKAEKPETALTKTKSGRVTKTQKPAATKKTTATTKKAAPKKAAAKA